MDALEKRKEIKSKKPDFRRQSAHKKLRVKGTGYRKPRGLHSKMRLNKRGYVKAISRGYGSPIAAKNLHPKGLLPFIVSNISDLSKLDASKEGALLSSTLGLKKKIEIIKEAVSKKITVLNLKDPEAFIKEQEKKRTDVKSEKNAEKKERDEKNKQKKK